VTDRFVGKPRVVATAAMETVDIGTPGGGFRLRTPSVDIEVTFDLGDHEKALAALEWGVERVKAQIADAAEGRST
jgi:hypothetical protein